MPVAPSQPSDDPTACHQSVPEAARKCRETHRPTKPSPGGTAELPVDLSPAHQQKRNLLTIIIARAIILLLWLNLADPLGLLPERQGPLPFLPFFNITALALTIVFLLLWRSRLNYRFQLVLQVAADLALTTLLVGHTRGIESTFVSFYLLVIIYCSLTLGRAGGNIAAALSTILYAAVVTADGLQIIGLESHGMKPFQAAYRITAHALGFWAVALLGTCLHQRLRSVESELKERTDSFTQLQRLNEHIVSSIRSGLITTNLDGQITLFNAAAGELTGKSSTEMQGKWIHEIIGKPFWTRIQNPDLLSNARPLRHEQWIDIPGGTPRFLGFSVSPLNDQDQRLLGYIISFQDLTEITRLEEEVRLKDRMAVVGRMAAGIAHEIRNPLTAIRGSVEMLSSRSGLPDRDRKLLDILIRESDRLNKFVGDFMNYARPRKYEKRPLDLVPVLKDSVTLLRNSPEIREKYVVRLNIEDRDLWIHASADQLNQVFWNLTQNAVRAMPDGGELTITLRRHFDDKVQIVFQDSGIGMTQEDLSHLFQPLHSGFKGGLGLGLSITFQIMEDHNGKLAFESEKGKGTKVVLTFPLEKSAPAYESMQPAIARLSRL